MSKNGEMKRQILRSILFIGFIAVVAFCLVVIEAVYRVIKEEPAATPAATGESIVVEPGQTAIATKTGIVFRPSITVTGRVTPVQ